MNRRLQTFLTLGIGLVLGGGLTVALSSANAQSESSWTCYVVDRLPDAKDAAEWKGAVKATEGLNKVAQNIAPNTIITMTYPVTAGFGNAGGVAPLVCVK